jgi:hypothetical protein
MSLDTWSKECPSDKSLPKQQLSWIKRPPVYETLCSLCEVEADTDAPYTPRLPFDNDLNRRIDINIPPQRVIAR